MIQLKHEQGLIREEEKRIKAEEETLKKQAAQAVETNRKTWDAQKRMQEDQAKVE